MNLSKSLATAAATVVISAGMVMPASAAPNVNNQSGGAAGLVAAVVQANIQDVRIDVVEVGDVNVTLENILNNNRVLNNVLNNNDVDVTVVDGDLVVELLNGSLNNIDINDVVDIAVVDNTLVISVLSATGLVPA